MVSTTTMRYWWAAYRCLPGTNLEREIILLGRNAGVCAAPAYQAFQALDQALVATEYANVRSIWIPRACPTGIGGKTCQPDGTSCSLHNYGVAVDIDPFGYGNPHFQAPFGQGWNFSDCKIRRHHVVAVEAIRNIYGDQMFRWLGWPIGDTMHFELQVPPSKTEVDWGTVLGQGVDMAFLPLMSGHGYQSPPSGSLATGDQSHRAEDVRALQDMMNHAFGLSLNLDGLYGSVTVAAVKAHLGVGHTGNPDGQAGLWVGGNQFGDLVAAMSRTGSGLTRQDADALYQAKGTIPPHGHNYAAKSHGHTGTIVETKEVTLT